MERDGVRLRTRRRLLRYLLAGPLTGGLAGLLPASAAAHPERAIPATLDEVLDVFQVEAAARARLDADVWHFIVNGADDGRTVLANRTAFDAWQIRVRRLVDVSQVDISLQLLGHRLPSPVILAPAGGQQLIHPDREEATMRGASGRGHLMIASTVSNASIGAIRAAGSAPLWFQLYPSPDRGLMVHLLTLAGEAGCPAVVLTVDSPTRGNRLAERWFSDQTRSRGRLPLGNLDGQGGGRIGDPALTWDVVDWLRSRTTMKILLKGIVTREDAVLAVERGVDGLVVSNHGGRQEESGRGTLDCLPEVLEAVAGRLPVLVDGGFRRGTDVYKAMALGAAAVCVGRPYLYGLGAWGEAGVARVMAILDEELVRIMQFAGVTRLADIRRDSLARAQDA